MVTNWSPHILDDLITIAHGYAFKSRYFSDSPTADILLTPGNFSIGGGFKNDKLKYYDGDVPDEYVLGKGDLLVTMTDLSKQADTLGYPAFVPETPGKRYLHNQRLGRVEIRESAPLEKRFLYYLLCTQEYRNEVIASATGTTVKHTAPKRIAAYKFKLPTRGEQRAIAHILGSLDDMIDLRRRMNSTLEAIVYSIFKSWFIDFDPVRANANGGDTGLPDEITRLFPDSFETSGFGDIPKGWQTKPIGEAVQCVGGATPSTKNADFWDGGTNPFLTPKDMSSLSSLVILDTDRHITDAGVEKISSKSLPTGTVVLSSRAPIGYLAISEVPLSVNQGIIAMICNGDLPNYYVLCWTMANMETIKSNAGGTTFAEISKKNFRPIPVLVPEQSILDAFTNQVEPLFKQIVENVVAAESLAATRDALLPKLTSGELTIPVADKWLESN